MEYFGEVLDAKENERRYPKDTLVSTVSRCPPLVLLTLLSFVVLGPWLTPLQKVCGPTFGLLRLLQQKVLVSRWSVTSTLVTRSLPVMALSTGGMLVLHSTVDVPDWEWDLSDPFAAPLAPVVSYCRSCCSRGFRPHSCESCWSSCCSL